MARKKRERAEGASIDLTPMIDVVFQLIIFFVVTVNLDQQSVMEQIRLPDAPHSREPKGGKDPRQVTIQVDKRGRYFIGVAPYSLKQLKIVLNNAVHAAGGTQNVPILIRGDAATAHRYIRRAMDVCAEIGLYKIRFAAMKQAAEKPRAP
jgi:biopolymer transport protein ExbD